MVDTKVGRLEEDTDFENFSYSRLFSISNFKDRVILAFGILFSVLTGFGLPSFIYFFGDVMDDYGKVDPDAPAEELKKIQDTMKENVANVTLIIVYLGKLHFLIFIFIPLLKSTFNL